jgi:hypothetical protein
MAGFIYKYQAEMRKEIMEDAKRYVPGSAGDYQ